jgi:hypothetical protein
MRSMSFQMTTDQILNRTKSVTRRLGWQNLQPGTLIRAVRKCQGLKKGERMEPLAVLRVESVRRESLLLMHSLRNQYGVFETVREGFPDMTPEKFIDLFCEANGCRSGDPLVTRIEFRYVPGGRLTVSA